LLLCATMTTLAYAPGTPLFPAPVLPRTARCRGVLTYLNGLAEDEEWHCDLLEGHEGVCCAPDGTSW
jgi:hypothetical protein